MGYFGEIRGLFEIKFILEGGFICEYIKEGCVSAKRLKGWRVSLRNKGKGRGFWAKCPFLPLPSSRRAGEGKRGSGAWGIDSPAHLGSGRGEGAG